MNTGQARILMNQTTPKVKRKQNQNQKLHMKKSVLSAIMASMLFITPTLGACGDDGNDAPSQSSGNVVVSVAPEILSSGPESATLELTVTADADWAVKSDADWVSLRPSGGIKNESTIVKVTVQTNSGMEERTAAINIVSGAKR